MGKKVTVEKNLLDSALILMILEDADEKDELGVQDVQRLENLCESLLFSKKMCPEYWGRAQAVLQNRPRKAARSRKKSKTLGVTDEELHEIERKLEAKKESLSKGVGEMLAPEALDGRMKGFKASVGNVPHPHHLEDKDGCSLE